MSVPKSLENGFTLIELLIVVAILGVLAAVVIPNVGQFIGAGELEARQTDYQTVQTAVHQMMVDNEIASIPNPVDYAGSIGVNDMAVFPDATSEWTGTPGGKEKDPDGSSYQWGDLAGYRLYGHDITGDGDQTELVYYVVMATSQYYYTCESDGTVRQWSDSSLTTEYTY